MEEQRKKLNKALDNIQDEQTLERILQFVKEETAVYNISKSEEHLEEWQIK